MSTSSIALVHRIGAMVLVAMLGTGSEAFAEIEAGSPAAKNAEAPDGAVEGASDQPTHFPSGIIRPAGDHGSSLKAFVVAPDGNIVALVDLGNVAAPPADEDEGAEVSAESASGVSSTATTTRRGKPPVATCEVRTFSAQGKHKQISAWPVSFRAQTMALGPDHCLYVAGSGRMGRYSLEGEELAIADSPQSALIEKDREALRQAAEGQIEDEKEPIKKRVAAYETHCDTLAARIEKTPDIGRQRMEAQLKQLDHQIKQLTTDRTVEGVMAAITERVKRINAIAASETEVFMTCSQTKGYGYCVWRMDLDFTNPTCIVTGLSGCCGQMDVCCADGDLWVAENSRHRVVATTAKENGWRRSERPVGMAAGASFGGCCNPMNLCFDKDGDLLVSESDGHVKHFTAKGEFVGLAGMARVRPGCKNSAVRVSPDGEQIYYIDVHQSRILILTRGEANAQPDPTDVTDRLTARPASVPQADSER